MRAEHRRPGYLAGKKPNRRETGEGTQGPVRPHRPEAQEPSGRAYLKEQRPGSGNRDAAFVNHRGRRLSYRNLYYRLRQLGERAGVDGLRPHRLRHTFGTSLHNYKLDLFYVTNQLGHSSVNTTEIYAKTPESSKTEQMKGFEESLNM